MTPPTPIQPEVGLVRLRVLQSDATDYTPARYLSGEGARGNHSKAPDGCGLSFTANALEDIMAADGTVLEDAFVVPERYESGAWTEFGTPYLLSPGSGTVIGPRQAAAREHVPVGVGALHGLASECIVLPNDCDDASPTMRYACGIEGNRYFGWQSKAYTIDATWNDADIYTPAAGSAKEGEPSGWDDAASSAAWVFRDADEGGLTLFRFGTFTLASRTVVKFIATADEEFKVYLDGPNMGGVVIDSAGNETGYTDKSSWKRRLEPGTYGVYAEMTTVDSTGGDGNDSLRFACGTIDNKGQIDTLLLASGASTKVRRQSKNDERPGLTVGEVVRRLLQENADQGVTGADILLTNRTFTDTLDSSGAAWDDGREWVWPLGHSVASCLMDMSEDADFDLTTGFEFEAWNDRGADLSATVALIPATQPTTAGESILEYGWTSDPTGPTRFLTLSQDGYDIVVGTSAELDTRPRFGFFESGASASIGRAKRNARAAIRQAGRIRRYYTAKIAAIAGAVPHTDFSLCDVINARGYRNLGLDLEVTDIAWEQGQGTTLFSVELGEV